jgi:hypothetical protein
VKSDALYVSVDVKVTSVPDTPDRGLAVKSMGSGGEKTDTTYEEVFDPVFPTTVKLHVYIPFPGNVWEMFIESVNGNVKLYQYVSLSIDQFNDSIVAVGSGNEYDALVTLNCAVKLVAFIIEYE